MDYHLRYNADLIATSCLPSPQKVSFRNQSNFRNKAVKTTQCILIKY